MTGGERRATRRGRATGQGRAAEPGRERAPGIAGRLAGALLWAVAGCAGQAPGGMDMGPGALLPMLCVTSPMATPFAGTAACPAPLPQDKTGDGLDAALRAIGWTRCDVKIPPATADLSGFPPASDDPLRLPDYDDLHAGPLRLPGWARQAGAWLSAGLDDDQAGPVVGALQVASLRLGHPVTACLDAPAYAGVLGAPQPLAGALAALITAQGGTADAGGLQAQVAAVPMEVQQALVPIVAAVDHAATAVIKARGKLDDSALAWLQSNAPRTFTFSTTLTDERVSQLQSVRVDLMADAAALVAAAVQGAHLDRLGTQTFPPVEVDTPIGKFVLHGSGSDDYTSDSPGDAVALLVDLGGDDTYEIAAGAATVAQPVSVFIDAGGADQYRYVTHPNALDTPGRLPSDDAGRISGLRGRTNSRTGRQGSGILGIGMLFDLGGGKDSYRSLSLSQGAGVLGVGVLYDDGGDDDYRAEVASQGAAGWGIGLLIDRSGKDAYRTYSLSQGFGYTGGAGLLVDGDGDDIYFANPGDPMVKADPELPQTGGDPMYQSAQLLDAGNNSMCQGAGFGRRADNLPDMIFLSGGLGLLYDRRGNDRYLASVFAQGSGYYRGIGVLLDGAGDDTYEGLWYVQGAAAHVSIGVLLDESGNDRYNPTFPIRATSIGTSNDFSVGMQIDGGGDDAYVAPGLSLGSGYAEGFGILINVGGADRYTAAGYPTLGGATISTEFPYTIQRAAAPTLGLFADLGGADTYLVPTVSGFTLPAKNNGSWTDPEILRANPMGNVPHSEMSVGYDDDNATATLP